MRDAADQEVSADRIAGALWVLSGAVTLGLSEVAQVMGHTGQRLYGSGGELGRTIGLVLICLGAFPVVKRFLGGIRRGRQGAESSEWKA